MSGILGMLPGVQIAQKLLGGGEEGGAGGLGDLPIPGIQLAKSILGGGKDDKPEDKPEGSNNV
jgi:hypothetical protein